MTFDESFIVQGNWTDGQKNHIEKYLLKIKEVFKERFPEIVDELDLSCEYPEKGIGVNYFTTSKDKIENEPDYKGFYWNPKKKELDTKAFEEVSVIINLVGESIAQRWTPEQKEKIVATDRKNKHKNIPN